MNQMIDADYDLSLSWLRAHHGQFKAMGVYIGGRRAAHVHSPTYVKEVVSLGYNVLPIWVGSQYSDIVNLVQPDATGRLEARQAIVALANYHLSASSLAWDYEGGHPVTSNVLTYLRSVGSMLNGSRRFLYSSLSELNAIGTLPQWSGMWEAHYVDYKYNPTITTTSAALQYAANVVLDHQNIDISVYNDKILFPGGTIVSQLSAPACAIISTPTGNGYYVFAGDGGVFAYGDALFVGSVAGESLQGPIVDAVLHPSGNGYWLVGSDGGVFAFGNAKYHGSPNT